LQRVTILGETYEIMHDRFFASEAIAELARMVSELAGENGEVTASEFRDHIGTGRKLAIRILEYFDKTGFTRRVGDAHRVRDSTLVVERIKKNAGSDSSRRETQIPEETRAPVERPDFKSGKGRQPVLGGFDSHSLPPIE
jgi:selenocysteine-specific elongation factor